MIYEIQSGQKGQGLDQIDSRYNNQDLKKNTNISLNGLLKWYLNVDNAIKEEVRLLMRGDIYFWLKVI